MGKDTGSWRRYGASVDSVLSVHAHLFKMLPNRGSGVGYVESTVNLQLDVLFPAGRNVALTRGSFCVGINGNTRATTFSD